MYFKDFRGCSVPQGPAEHHCQFYLIPFQCCWKWTKFHVEHCWQIQIWNFNKVLAIQIQHLWYFVSGNVISGNVEQWTLPTLWIRSGRTSVWLINEACFIYIQEHLWGKALTEQQTNRYVNSNFFSSIKLMRNSHPQHCTACDAFSGATWKQARQN